MCVICVKPINVGFPSDERMADMFSSNDDGAGFMFTRDGKVEIRKGFMKFKHFRRALRREGLTEADTVIMHFRIGTAGSNSPQNTHPFPVTDDIQLLRATTLSTDIGMAHNGILSYGGDKENDLSDTMAFVREVISHKPIRDSLFDLPTFTLIEYAIGSSKMVFLNGKNDFVLLGEWKEDPDKKDKCYYSNLIFNNRWTNYGTGSSYNDRYKTYPIYGYVQTKEGKWVPEHEAKALAAFDKIQKDNGVYELDKMREIKALPAPTNYDFSKVDWDALTEDEWREMRLKQDMQEIERSFRFVSDKPKEEEKSETQKALISDSVFVDYDDDHCPNCHYHIASIQQVSCTKCGKFFYRPHEAEYYGGY